MRSLLFDKSAMRSNLNAIKVRTDSADIIADLSCDGQGAGLLEMAEFLRDEGLGYFAVSDPADAFELRSSGFTEEKILVLRSVTKPGLMKAMIDRNIIFSISSYDAAIALNGAASELHTIAEAKIRINTGACRSGFLPCDADKVENIFRHMPGITVTGLYSIPAPSNVLSDAVHHNEVFCSLVDSLAGQGLNTGSVFYKDYTLLLRCPDGAQTAVIEGPAIIGISPLKDNGGLKKACQLRLSLDALNWLSPGAFIGTDKSKQLKKPMRVAVLDAGWANGIGIYRSSDRVERGFLPFIRSILGRNRSVPVFRINGKKAKILGRIGPDSILLDVTRCECSPNDCAVMEVDPRLIHHIPVEFAE